MKIVIAPDSFKGSLTSKEVATAIKEGIQKANPKIKIDTVPIADGGEGTLDAITNENDRIKVCVKDPLGWDIQSEYGTKGDIAVIEIAKACGLTLLEENKRSASNTNTFGVGQLITDALNKGFRKFLLTLGGSATNDGGTGMFCALGAKFIDKKGISFVPTGKSLEKISKIDISKVNPLLNDCTFTVATDVTNPLTGKFGATNVYGKQKGATNKELKLLEKGMKNYAKILSEMTGKDMQTIKGGGAAGGTAIPLLAFYNAKIESGISSVLKIVNFDKIISDADIIITGEGKIDKQSLFGKAISGVTTHARQYNIPVYCFVGAIGDDMDELKKMGIQDIFEVRKMAVSIEDSMQNTTKYLQKLAFDFAKHSIMNS